jgi:proton-coupled amino acid transporter
MILGEVAIFLPLAMIRNLAKLSGTALVADAFILIGSKSAGILPSRYTADTPSCLYRVQRVLDDRQERCSRCGHVQPRFFPALGRYRRVRLRRCWTVSQLVVVVDSKSKELTRSVIPITQSMKEPKKFPGVLSGVMLVVAILFGGAGAVGYMAYGSDIQTVVLVNLPQDDKFVQAVQFLCTSFWSPA